MVAVAQGGVAVELVSRPVSSDVKSRESRRRSAYAYCIVVCQWRSPITGFRIGVIATPYIKVRKLQD